VIGRHSSTSTRPLRGNLVAVHDPSVHDERLNPTNEPLLHRTAPNRTARLAPQVKHQLNVVSTNDYIGGSLALAVASALVGFAWRLVHSLRSVLHDTLFRTYDIPPGSPQHAAALRWLYHQPAVCRTSRRLVINPTAPATDAYGGSGGGVVEGAAMRSLTSLGGSGGGASSSGRGDSMFLDPSDSAPHDPDDPLELGLHTVPMLLQNQSVCVRVGAALVWAGHGGGGGGSVSRVGGGGAGGGGGGGAGGIGGGEWGRMGAMGGGGARGSWRGLPGYITSAFLVTFTCPPPASRARAFCNHPNFEPYLDASTLRPSRDAPGANAVHYFTWSRPPLTLVR